MFKSLLLNDYGTILEISNNREQLEQASLLQAGKTGVPYLPALPSPDDPESSGLIQSFLTRLTLAPTNIHYGMMQEFII